MRSGWKLISFIASDMPFRLTAGGLCNRRLENVVWISLSGKCRQLQTRKNFEHTEPVFGKNLLMLGNLLLRGIKKAATRHAA